jgi:hypothetical protein
VKYSVSAREFAAGKFHDWIILASSIPEPYRPEQSGRAPAATHLMIWAQGWVRESIQYAG